MCGIAGFYGASPLDPHAADQALKILEHRGPDASSAEHFTYGSDRHICLLHRRLSIIDLEERSHQPFSIGPYTIIFNGELYNYIEIRDELRAAGISFRTDSDTEVLLQLLIHQGLDGLDKCEGMWAFAFYDGENGLLHLCRDRFGEKPLFFMETSNGFYFASEIKALPVLSGEELQVNKNHLLRYLVNGYKSLYKQPDNFFLGVESIEPAQVLTIKPDGSKHVRSYWAPTFHQSQNMRYDEAVEGVRDRLISSVKLRMRSDVPLAFCMSGGIDSNSLIGIATNVLNIDVHGFTIVNTDSRYEENEMLEAAVEDFGVSHTAIPLATDNFLPNLRQLIRQHDAPVYTISYYVHWLLQKRMAEAGYKISISGTAADELFSGYYDHHNAYLAEMKKHNPDVYEDALQKWKEHQAPIVRNPYLQDPDYYYKNPKSRAHIYLDQEKFSSYLKKDWHEPFIEEIYTEDLLRNRMANELFHEAIPVILHEDDKNAMSVSIENRSPFLDRELFEWSTKIPTRHLFRDGMAKAVLRDAMRGIVPDIILDQRRKVGFNAPIFDLLDIQDPTVKEWLLDDSGYIYDLIDRSAIETLVNQKTLKNSESKFLFYFVCSKLFLEEN